MWVCGMWNSAPRMSLLRSSKVALRSLNASCAIQLSEFIRMRATVGHRKKNALENNIESHRWDTHIGINTRILTGSHLSELPATDDIICKTMKTSLQTLPVDQLSMINLCTISKTIGFCYWSSRVGCSTTRWFVFLLRETCPTKKAPSSECF